MDKEESCETMLERLRGKDSRVQGTWMEEMMRNYSTIGGEDKKENV